MGEAESSFSITGPDSAALGAVLLIGGLLLDVALGGWLLGRRPARDHAA
jgi:hypothetical protein